MITYILNAIDSLDISKSLEKQKQKEYADLL